MSTAPGTDRRTSGWVLFVCAYLAIAGVLNLVYGVAALAEKGNFREDDLIWSTLSVWAWIGLITGAVQMAGAALVASRRVGGVVIAGFLAFLGLLVNFLAIGAYPIWSAILMGVNALILWAATVHSDEFI